MFIFAAAAGRRDRVNVFLDFDGAWLHFAWEEWVFAGQILWLFERVYREYVGAYLVAHRRSGFEGIQCGFALGAYRVFFGGHAHGFANAIDARVRGCGTVTVLGFDSLAGANYFCGLVVFVYDVYGLWTFGHDDYDAGDFAFHWWAMDLLGAVPAIVAVRYGVTAGRNYGATLTFVLDRWDVWFFW